MTDPQQHIRPVYLQPRVVLVWVVTAAWAGAMSELSTGAYSGSVTGWLLAQLLLSLHIHLAPQTFATVHFLIRKLAHCSEYAVFGLLLYHSFEPRHPERWDTRGAFGALLVAGLFSLADEYHQSFVPGRTASLVDSGIDTAGALLGMVLLYGGRRLQASHSSRAAENESKAEMKKGTGE
ncbi:MAG: VanZ family protein [Terriglobia bacterium]